MKISVAKTDLHNALAIAGITVESGNDLSGHYLFRLKDGACEVLSYGLRSFASAVITAAEIEGEDGDAFTVEASRLNQWMSGVSGNKALTLQNDEEGQVTLQGERTKIRLRSLDPTKFPFWDDLLSKGEVIGSIAPGALARALACSRWFVSEDDTSKPELCQVEAVDGVLWATDRRALSSVMMPRLPELSVRIPGKDVPAVLRFLSEKRTQEAAVIEVIQAERPFEDGGGACMVLKRPDDGAYIGVTRPTASFPTLNVDRDEKDQSILKFSREEFNSAIAVLLAGAPVNHPSVTFRYDEKNGVSLAMPCEAGGEDDFPLESAEVMNGENWDTEFVIDYAYIKGIADTFNLDQIEVGVNKRGRGGFVSFRHSDVEEDGKGNDYFSVIVWRS
jgi:hypothetical protein